MIPAQPILIILVAMIVVLYFAKLRSRSSDVVVLMVCFGCATLLIFRPTVATWLANMVGIGRGVDLIIYLAIPGLALMLLLVFSRVRDLNLKLTAVVRELAISNVRTDSQAGPK